MKRTFAILACGALAAVLAQFAWFELRAPADPGDKPGDLAWLKGELHLSDAQYARICEIHQKSGPHIAALAAQVTRMRSELDAFENQRRSTGEIDFLEFARFVESRRAIDQECLQRTRQVVQDSAGQMTPEQRSRYLSMISPLLEQSHQHRN